MLITTQTIESLSQTQDICEWVTENTIALKTLEDWKTQSHSLYATNPKFALEIALFAERVAICLPQPASAFAAWMKGNALLFLSDFAGAAKALENARQHYLKHQDPLTAAQLSIGLVAAFSYLGNLHRSIEIGLEVESALLSVIEHNQTKADLLGRLYLNLGVAYEFLHQFEEALAILDKRVVLKGQSFDSFELARVQHNRGCILDKLNLYNEAQAAYAIAERGFQEASTVSDLTRLYLNRGLLEAHWGRYSAAERDFQQAFDTLEQDPSPDLLAYLRYYRSLNRLESGNVSAEIATEMNDVRIIFEKRQLVFDEAVCCITLGRYYTTHAKWGEAERILTQALNIIKWHPNPYVQWQIYVAQAQMFIAQKLMHDAIRVVEKALTAIESLRTGLYIETFRATFLLDKLDVYELLADLYLQQGQVKSALLTMERARAKLLSERLESRVETDLQHLTVAQSTETVRQLAVQLRSTLTALDQLHKRTREAQQLRDSFQATTQVESERVYQLEQQSIALIRDIQRHAPLFAPLSSGITRTLAECCHMLTDDSCLVFYTIIQENVYGFLINQTGIICHRRLTTLAKIKQLRQHLKININRTLTVGTQVGASMRERIMPAFLQASHLILAKLSSVLIEPLLSELAAYPHWIIAPERDLYYIPFHALRLGESYAIEQFKISYMPSLNVLHLSQQPLRVQGRGVALMGYGGSNLPGVEREIEMLARCFPFADAFSPITTDSFLQKAETYRLIHLAAHAHFRSDIPMLSAFELEDRALTLAEIARLQLGTEMIVLSACETGFGRNQGGDYISLAGGLMSAGARSLVVSQWNVEDEATLLMMQTFYTQLQQGHSRVAALQAAQCQLLQQAQTQPAYAIYAHPAYWAPFTLFGNWKALTIA